MSCALAIDMGGSKFMVGIVGDDGAVLQKRRFLWDDASPEGVMRSITAESRRILNDFPHYQISVAGATIPGLADPVSGLWIEASFLGIRDLPVAALLERELGFKTFIDNDANACTLAERMYGAAKGVADFAYFTVSNGCGGALFANDHLYLGGFGNAGEFGHLVVKEGGRQCKCGSRGCLEIEASGRAIPQNYRELGGLELIDGEAPTAQSIDRLARAGDPVAIKTYELEGYYLGRAAAMVANVFNPRLIVIGGGVSLGFDLFERSLLTTLNKQMYITANRGLKVAPTALGYDGALVGAAALGFNGLDKKF